MNIIGREEEKQILENILLNNESKFVAVYGRRRIGKTYLIRHCFSKHIVFECSGLNTKEEDKKAQLENFWINLNKKKTLGFITPTSWVIAFAYLEQYMDTLSENGKKVIFLDEISWFETQKSGFLSALSNFWNQYCTKRKDIVLVICGSSASWIIKNIVKNKGSLHNRLNRIIHLQPFTLSETKKYLSKLKIKLNDKDIAQLYMITGGVPYYLAELKAGSGIPKILDDLFFSKNAILKDEFTIMFAALFKNYKNHLLVLNALSKLKVGLTRKSIIAKTKLNSGGTLTETLDELEQCDFITSFLPYDKKKVNTIYRLTDEFILFYFKFLKDGTKGMSGSSLFSSQSFKSWSGLAFENLCLKHLDQIAKSIGISGISYQTYSFINSNKDGAQIDLLMDRSDNVINLIEAKFYNGVYRLTKAEAASISNKENVFLRDSKSNKAINFTLITSMGVEENEHYHSVFTNSLTLKDMLID